VDKVSSSAREDNSAIVRTIIEEAWNQGELRSLDALFEPDAQAAERGPHRQSVEQMRRAVRLYRSLAPELHVIIDQLLADRNAVMVRWTAHGTHTGEVEGIATADILQRPDSSFHLRILSTIYPNGQRLSFEGVAVFQISNGKIVSAWLLLDEIEVLRQLGALPVAQP
jgi:predicted ester cyclase